MYYSAMADDKCLRRVDRCGILILNSIDFIDKIPQLFLEDNDV